MNFAKLRLAGFKTFVEATEAPIDPGLTGIVGPNGCGKSNLVEALRWVMGESSFKSLRASGMEDVIFAGSGGRPARNHAEVTLTLHNAAGVAPEPFDRSDEIEVSRKISRGLGSSYRINGREVRARDVQLLFADASSGARSPALVGQGRVSEIINARPDQRRRILEEAAGVTGLNVRRREAEQRLEAAGQNLVRVEDVLGRLGQHAEQLRRQAKDAQRYRALTEEIRTAETLVLLAAHAAATSSLVEAESAEAAALTSLADAMRAQGEAARAEAIAGDALGPARIAVADAELALRRLVQIEEALIGEEVRARARLEDLDRRVVQIDADLLRERALAADAAASLERIATSEAAPGLQEGRDGEIARRRADERRVKAEALLDAAEAALAAATEAAGSRQAERRDLARRRDEAVQRLAALDREAAVVAAESARLAADMGAEDDPAVLVSDVEQARERAVAAERAVEAAEAEHAGARAEETAARSPAALASARAERATTEARTLAKLLGPDERGAFTAAVDLLVVDRGFETALGAALGDDLDAAVDPRAPARWTLTPNGAAAVLPAGAVPLGEHVVAPPELARRLAQIGVVERADGALLQPLLAPGQRLVSREGDLWRWDGLILAADAATPSARRLVEKNRLAAVARDAAAARAEADRLRLDVDAACRRTSRASGDEETARETAKIARRQADAAREALVAAERTRTKVVARFAALDEAGSRVAAQRALADADGRAAEAALAGLTPASIDDVAFAALRRAAAEARDAATARHAEAASLEAEARRAASRRTELAAERVSWTRRRDGAAERLDDLDRRFADVEVERGALAARPADIAGRLRVLQSERAEAEAIARSAADAHACSENAHLEAGRAARTAIDALGAAREATARTGVRLEAAREKRDGTAARIREAHDLTPAELTSSLAGVEQGSREAVEERLARAIAARDRLGPVNLRAEQELAEVEAGHDALAAERDDLTAAIERLRGGIRSLNQEGRGRLLAAFQAVDRHFRRLFETLFNGGEARLELVESDDPLEAGLEVIARPPGKKPQTLSLLSGGEQALTALALVFGVFLTNPSPLCVLDEVDAPLDDANVERFCALLAEMRRATATRFLTVTHNPITMARMDRLLGVTMAERGVSQLVTVDLQAAEQLLQAV